MDGAGLNRHSASSAIVVGGSKSGGPIGDPGEPSCSELIAALISELRSECVNG